MFEFECMESEIFAPSRDSVKCCDCACPTCSLIGKPSSTWFRSVKRKYDEFETGNQFYVPEFDLYSNPKIQIENECVALRETVSTQQATIQDLQIELEKERNASSSAANEAMSMILKLQKQKAEIQMEANQFKRFAEEKMAHDQEEILALEDILYKREEGVESLTCEAMAYNHRMISYDLTEAEVEGEKDGEIQSMGMDENFDAEVDLSAYDYPPLKCSLNENLGEDIEDIEKYTLGETPNIGEQLRDLEQRLFQAERDSRSSQMDGGFPGRNVEQRVFQVERDSSNSQMDGGFSGENVQQGVFQVERDSSSSQMDGGFPGENVQQGVFQVERDSNSSHMDGDFPGRNVEQTVFQVERDSSSSQMDGGFSGENVRQGVFQVERDSSSSQMDGGFPGENVQQGVFQVERDPDSSQMDGGFPVRNLEQRIFQVEGNPGSSQMDEGFPVRNLEQKNFEVERDPINNQMDGGFPIKNLEQRNFQEERNPRSSQVDESFPRTKNVLEKVIVGHSPRRTRHSRRVSTESYNSLLAKETASEFTIDSPRFNIASPRFNASYKKMEFVSKMDEISNSRRNGNTSEVANDLSDRVYTIDSVHHGVTYNETPKPKLGAETANEYESTPRGDFNLPDSCDPYIKKLYTRLQALEADRESMRQALLSMRTDKAQLVLLKEIAQHLSKEMPSNRQVVAKPSIMGSLPFMLGFKWIASLIFWRRKARRSKYLYGLSPNNVGLLMLLDKGPRPGQWRCLSSTQV